MLKGNYSRRNCLVIIINERMETIWCNSTHLTLGQAAFVHRGLRLCVGYRCGDKAEKSNKNSGADTAFDPV